MYQGRVPANAERVIQETRTVLETLQLLVAQLRKQSMQASLMHFQQPAGMQRPLKSQSFASQSSFQNSFASIRETKSVFSSQKTNSKFTSVQEQSRSLREFEEHGPVPVRHVHSVQSFQVENADSRGHQRFRRDEVAESQSSSIAEELPASSKAKYVMGRHTYERMHLRVTLAH